MGCTSVDLTIEAAMADPMIAAAMRADGVDPRRLEHLLRSTARDLDAARRPSMAACCAVPEPGRAMLTEPAFA